MEMEMEFLRKLPTPQELKEQHPVSAQIVATKTKRDDEIRNIFEGKSDKLILVIGPCSADNEDAVIDYISRLRTVQEKVADKIFMIPRIYTNKPRTTGIGYKGMLHQPGGIEIEEVLSPEVKSQVLNLVHDLFLKEEHEPEDEEEQIRETIMNVIRDILSDGDVMYNMMDLKNYDDYTYFHSVNVATLAAVLGVRYGLSEYELKVLTTGALLHDIGKKFVKADVLNARRPLTEEEKRMVLQHPKLGYEFLKRNYDFDPDVCEGVLGHHEWYNGEGYPLRRSGENISIYARIIKVADVYDAMTSKRSYHDALSPSDAVEYIMAMNESEFDPAVVDIFLKWVAVYPVGCEVELSDGRHAVVVKNYHDFLLRPKIRVMESGEEIDLLSDIDARHITILRLAV